VSLRKKIVFEKILFFFANFDKYVVQRLDFEFCVFVAELLIVTSHHTVNSNITES